MDRSDSGFDQSYRLKATDSDLVSVHRSDTASSGRKKSKKTSLDSKSSYPPVPMDYQRPSSEKQSTRHRRSGEPRRSSITSSSDQSGKSRGRYGSKPSSRRTSCTLVDPSRPARHYRIKSSQTVSTAGHDLDDVLALHFRSCSLFQKSPYSTPDGQANPNTHAVDNHGFLVRTSPDLGASPQHHADGIEVATSPERTEETVATLEATNTVTDWMSPSTRKKEYERIDRENSGIRGLMRRIVPRCVSGPPPTRFHDPEKDTSDTGSVRRYRIDFDEEEASEKDVDQEKSNSSLRIASRKLTPRERSTVRTTTKTKKFWGCF
ncbi:hypothetical protein BDV96DRAFT_493390 [Lophiotrema nucula]|uniref:Uncharacterized protein n=1 Tax=Lophiotrema nucula TaxID=690887 RepID=A0A6A5Z9V8_9PLEO|nr:hypothetical protein BDV96DRAFT_493390 [Lophiotrema nucula]